MSRYEMTLLLEHYNNQLVANALAINLLISAVASVTMMLARKLDP